MFSLSSRVYSRRHDYDTSSLITPSLTPVKKQLTAARSRPSSREGSRASSREGRKKEYEKSEKSFEELCDEEEKDVKNKEIEIVCNGIKYRGVFVEEAQLPDLICEECEKAKSVLKCEECDQVFCSYCFEICHVRPEMGTVLHPHELNRAIRPIREGDTSSIIADNSFKMPDYEYYEQEMVKHRNLTVPNSLAANGILAPLSNQPCLSLKYHRGDVLVYMDPITHQEVYGRVESEWDLRSGNSAPSLIRGGEGGLTHYVVRYLGPVTPLILCQLERDEDPTTGLSMNQSKNKESREANRLAKLQSMPILEGVQSAQLRSERVLANQIDKRLNSVRYLRAHGPLHHLNPPIPKGFASDSPDEDDGSLLTLEATEEEQKSISESDAAATASAGPRQSSSSSRLGATVSTSHVKSTRPLTLTELRTQALPSSLAAKRTLEGVVAAYSLIAEVQSSLSANVPPYDISKEPPLLERRQQILILPEAALAKPSDRVKLQELRRREDIRLILTKRFALLFQDWVRYSFQLWVEWNRQYTLRLQSIVAVKIQAQFRRWLCRDIIRDLQDISAEKLHRQWLKVHSRFHYCSADTPGAVTMDNKIYFASLRDVNRYGRQLRIAVSKFVKVANRQRIICLSDSLAQWREVVQCSKEIDLKVTHCSNYEAIRGERDRPEKLLRQEHVKEVRRLHSKLRRDLDKTLHVPPEDMAKIDADPSDDSRFGILSLPMGLQRERSQAAPPPWHPSVGFHDAKSLAALTMAQQPNLSEDAAATAITTGDAISRAPSRAKSRGGGGSSQVQAPLLPDLLPLPDLLLKNKQATLSKVIEHSLADKQRYNSFRAMISGPTDHSCWIIPGKLAMGRIPVGKARAKGPVDSIIHTFTDSLSQLLLVGINSFVSLVEPDEEETALLQFPDSNGDVDDGSSSGIISFSSSVMTPASAVPSGSVSVVSRGGPGPSVNSMRDRLRKCHREVKMELKSHLVVLQDQYETKNIQLEEYAHIEEASPHLPPEKLKRIEQQKREKLRLVAKRKLILDEMELTKKAIEKFPHQTTWSSFPLKHNSVPPLDHTIPILWELEQRLWQGECLYVYSKDGNGRAGLICACLLGRLYGLTHTETLLRMQSYFDCQRSQQKYQQPPSEDGKISMSITDSVSATCPQMSRQQELVSRILLSTNRVFQGISSCSQTNPESLTTVIEQPKRGLRIETAMEEKWRSPPTVHSKSSLELKTHSSNLACSNTNPNSSGSSHYQSERLGRTKEKDKQHNLPEICSSSSSFRASVSESAQAALQLEVKELFPQTVLQSIGRRSSTVARILPTSAPTLCDSPVKLRVL